MKLRGGYNVPLQGRPAGRVETLPEPEVLHLPLSSRRFAFSQLAAEEGQRVLPGQVLARDPDNHAVPLLAPRAGTVRLDAVVDHITLEDVEKVPEEPFEPDEQDVHAPQAADSAGLRRYKLVELGAWQFLEDAFTGDLPDPFGTPGAVLVSTVHMEPYVARGDVQLHKRLAGFTRGLHHLQSLLEYQPVYLVLPDIRSEFGERVREALRGYAWLRPAIVPRRYGLDNYEVLARHIELERTPERPVWALDVAGLLAVDRALTASLPSTVRIIALGGPAVKDPVHAKAMAGYPLDRLLAGRLPEGPARVIDGGVLTGRSMPEAQKGLGAECDGLTVLPEHTSREFLGFMRPGLDRQSYSRCFLSLLRSPFAERFSSALRGERRPCIGCGACEQVCPAAIMPHLIHKWLYQNALEEAEQSGLHLCVRCGLCSYVCPSKIELRGQFVEAQHLSRAEHEPAEVTP